MRPRAEAMAAAMSARAEAVAIHADRGGTA